MKRNRHDIKILLLALISMVLLSSCHTSKKATGDLRESETEYSSGRRHDSRNKRHSKFGKEIVEEAYTWLGTPYAYAHAEKGVATDCSGMVLKVYDKITGVKLPRNSAKQAEFCESIRQKDVVIGDLVFFATGKNAEVISHVGIMVDEKNFIHASASKGVVISDMTQPYYVRTFKGFGRVNNPPHNQ